MSYELTRKDKTYLDVSLAFEANPVTKDLTVLKDVRAINNALKNCVMIKPSEAPFNRDFGSQVTDYLFDVVDMGTAGLLQQEIERTIRFNEPRVELISVEVRPRFDQNEFVVTITYKIVGTDTTFVTEQILYPTR